MKEKRLESLFKQLLIKIKLFNQIEHGHIIGFNEAGILYRYGKDCKDSTFYKYNQILDIGISIRELELSIQADIDKRQKQNQRLIKRTQKQLEIRTKTKTKTEGTTNEERSIQDN